MKALFVAVGGATSGKATGLDSHVTGSDDVQSEAEHSQPKLDELPKHSKNAVAGSHAAPLKVMLLNIEHTETLLAMPPT